MAAGNRGRPFIDASLAYGLGSFTTQRYVATGTLSERLNGSFEGHLFGGRIEGGWRFETAGGATVTPFAGLAVQVLRTNGYTETATSLGSNTPGVLGLTVQAQTTTSVRSILGAQVSTSFVDEWQTVYTPRLKLGWAHEFNPERSSRAAFATLAPNLPFTVTGARAAADSLVVSAGVDIDLSNMVRLYAQFDGEYAAQASSWSGMGGIRLFW